MNFLVYSIVSLFHAAIVIDCQKVPSLSQLKIAHRLVLRNYILHMI